MFSKILKVNLLALVIGLAGLAHAQDSGESVATSQTPGGFFSTDRWSLAYVQESYSPAFAGNGDDVVIKSAHLVPLTHKFPAEGWTLTPIFYFTTAVGDKNSAALGDSYLALGTPALYTHEATGIKVTLKPRYYAPISEKSRAADHAGVLNPRVYITGSTGKWAFNTFLSPAATINTKTVNDQHLFSLKYWFGTEYNVTDKFAVYNVFYPGFTKKRGADLAYSVLAYPGVSYKITENLGTYFEIESELVKADLKKTSATLGVEYTIF